MQLTRQLQRVRQIGRLMLVVQQLMRWVSAILVLLVLLGVVDYALRLPGWLRLAMGLTWVGIACVWLFKRLSVALRFKPALSLLALRAERLYPQTAGVLASAVEFDQPPKDQPTTPNTTGLTQSTLISAGRLAQSVSLKRLIKPALTVRHLLVACGVMLSVTGLVLAAPQASHLAIKRWLVPLGEAQWPRRVQLVTQNQDPVWPIDTPMRFAVKVQQGYHQAMRTWVAYRLVEPGGDTGPWQSLLMNEQSDTNQAKEHHPGVFERLVDLGQALTSDSSRPLPMVEYYFEAGDDITQPQMMQLVTRPTVVSVTVDIQPPVYAQGLVDQRHVTLDPQAGPLAIAGILIGSTIDISVVVNKPLPVPDQGVGSFFPGLGSVVEGGPSPEPGHRVRELHQSFKLDQSVQWSLQLIDEHGLTNLSDKVYRIDSIQDQRPAAVMTKPSADQAVLATAVVELQAVGQDDVGLESLSLQAQLPPPSPDENTDEQSQEQVLPLIKITDRAPSLTAKHTLDLQGLSLNTGDTVTLWAAAADVFDLNGQNHQPVRSAVRVLRIIDPVTLIMQLRTELAGVRQQVVRLDARQQRITDLPLPQANSQQHQLTEHLRTQVDQVDALQQRINRNRLNSPESQPLKQLIDRASTMLDQAQQLSHTARNSLLKAQNQPQHAQKHGLDAKAHQQQITSILAQLAQMLDQSRDALAHQEQLQQLLAKQQDLADQTRRLVPRTLGQTKDQLPDQDRQAIEQIAQKQAALSQQAQDLIQQMRASAESLSRQGYSHEDQAVAGALSESASIAQRQGLTQAMKKAAARSRQNQLAAAGNDQQSAMNTLEQMLQQMVSLDDRRQLILNRYLVQLADAIARLIEQQQDQADRLDQAQQAALLEGSQSAIRRHTIVVADEARMAIDTTQAVEQLDSAAASQGKAVMSLREEQRTPAAKAQAKALKHLQSALDLVQAVRDKSQAQKVAKQRQQLIMAYQKLAAQQQKLREQTKPLTGHDTLNRRQRASLIDLGNRQADLRIQAADLHEQVSQAPIFSHLHKRVDQAAKSVVLQLRTGDSSQQILDRQASIASMLKSMANALTTPPQDKPFASSPGGAKGGGGGGAGKPPPLVYPLAQLRLLRDVQTQIRDQTHHLDQHPNQPQQTADLALQLHQMATEQRELAELAKHLIQQAALGQ